MINFRINSDTIGTLVDAAGGVLADGSLAFQLESYATYVANFVTVLNGVLTPVDVSDAATWKAFFDKDFNKTTAVMVEVEDADIDSTDAATGILKISVDCDTPEFLTAVGILESIPAFFQICGYDETGKKIHSYIIKCTAWNAIEVTT